MAYDKTTYPGGSVLVIDKSFVQKWSSNYNKRFYGGCDQSEEKAIREWLSRQVDPKYLDKEYFVRLGMWKTKRQTSNYRANEESKIIEVTCYAYQSSDPIIKLRVLRTLRGVGVAVGATILHYLQPELFPIFDYHARTTLKEACLWTRKIDDSSERAWLEYLDTMRGLSSALSVSLRDLDKALFAYDKYRSQFLP